MPFLPEIPDRRTGRRRDRHGRGIRGPLLAPALPGWRTRAEKFDDVVTGHVQDLIHTYPRLARVEFAVEEVPPSSPSRYEPHAVALGRTFASDRTRSLRTRVVLYRLPITTRAGTEEDLEDLTRFVLVEQCADLLGMSPTDIDPDFPA